jgi:hypothetical protein
MGEAMGEGEASHTYKQLKGRKHVKEDGYNLKRAMN